MVEELGRQVVVGLGHAEISARDHTVAEVPAAPTCRPMLSPMIAAGPPGALPALPPTASTSAATGTTPSRSTATASGWPSGTWLATTSLAASIMGQVPHPAPRVRHRHARTRPWGAAAHPTAPWPGCCPMRWPPSATPGSTWTPATSATPAPGTRPPLLSYGPGHAEYLDYAARHHARRSRAAVPLRPAAWPCHPARGRGSTPTGSSRTTAGTSLKASTRWPPSCAPPPGSPPSRTARPCRPACWAAHRALTTSASWPPGSPAQPIIPRVCLPGQLRPRRNPVRAARPTR